MYQLDANNFTMIFSHKWPLQICKYFWTFDATQNTSEHSIICSSYTIWLWCSISIHCLSNWHHNFM